MNGDVRNTVFFLRRYQLLNVRLYKVLLEIYGINLSRVRLICNSFGLKMDVKLKDISRRTLRLMNYFVFKRFLSDKRLNRVRRELNQGILKSGSYRGLSRRRGLPVRGQRTKSNASTSKKLNIGL
jgi:small subunit ribosomal protein S13